MALDGCGLLCKYVLIFFNILFALAGIAMLGLGLWLRFSNDTKGIFEIEILNKSTFVIVVIGLIVMGSVMLFVVAFGDYGACNENRCALAVFSALLAVLAVAGVVAGVLTYTHGDEVGAQLAEFYTSMYGLYVAKMFMAKIDPAGLVTLSVFHHVFQCCGVLGALEIPVRDFCPERDGIVAKLEMPPCPVAIYDAFKTKAPMVLGFFLGLGALLILALVCSIILNAKLFLSSPQNIISSPQYIMLASTSTALATPYPGQNQALTPYPGQNQALTPYPGQNQALTLYPGQNQALTPYPGQNQALTLYPGQNQALTPYPGQNQATTPYPDPVVFTPITNSEAGKKSG